MTRRFTVVYTSPEPDQRGVERVGRRPPGERGNPAATWRVEGAELSGRDEADLARDPNVAAFAPTMPVRLIKPTSVSRRKSEAARLAWGLVAIGADQSTLDGSGFVPAVLDTGIDSTHPAFDGVEIVEADFTDTGIGDENGHGTHCAGTIFGRDVDEIRIGVARGVSKALIGKVLDKDGAGDSESLYRGMQWALDNGANVISMSIGFDFPGYVRQVVDEGLRADVATSLALEAYRRHLRTFDAIMRRVEIASDTADGAIVVAASGNESGRDESPPFEITVSVPAAASGVVSVGAVGRGSDGFQIAPFSNSLPVVVAPGVDVVSAAPGGGLVVMSGTSMATPHVAGVAILWWQQVAARRGRLTTGSVLAGLRGASTVEGISSVAEPSEFGDGLVRAP
jgi:subtilisin family serine protease